MTSNNPENYKDVKSIHEFVAKGPKGDDVSLQKYSGHVLLIINVASQCGLAATNFKELAELDQEYGESKGLKILAFPSNQFGQEPGDMDEVCPFAERKKVKFDLFDKIEVNGSCAHPLWKFLKHKQGGTLGDFIKWNFTKFVVDKAGVPVARYGPNVNPKEIVSTLEKYCLTMASPDDFKTASTIYDFTAKNIKGEDVPLASYKGHVAVIVNVASKCGFTENHYKELNELYDQFGENKGLKILAFPCNQFGGQEPGDANMICNFAEKKNVRFDLFDKVNVNGSDAHPLWKFLKHKQGGTLGDFIKWNFTKFVVDKDGKPVARFGPNVSPKGIASTLEKYL